MTNWVRPTFQTLDAIYRQSSYANIQLDTTLRKLTDDSLRKQVTHFVYGTLEKDTFLEYAIARLCQKRPKPVICVLLKMAIYAGQFSTKPSATVGAIIDFMKAIGKGGQAGFVNGVVRACANLQLPTDPVDRLSVTSSTPRWLLDMIIQQYGLDFATAFFEYKPSHLTHIRILDPKLALPPDATKNPTKLGYSMTHSTMKMLPKGSFCPQSYGSMLVVECLGRGNEGKLLDVCSAPGGKAIYAVQHNPSLKVTACDIHQHRVDLIFGYANALGVQLDIRQNDATVFNPEFEGQFDIVMCDVPCSGLGVVSGKPDIKLNRSMDDIDILSKLQLDILSTSARYVKSGGRLLYSTCTILKQENEAVVQSFLAKNPEFCLQTIDNQFVASGDDGFVRILPQTHDTDGFFVALLRRL